MDKLTLVQLFKSKREGCLWHLLGWLHERRLVTLHSVCGRAPFMLE